MGYGEWLAVPLFAIACQKSFLWRRGTDRPAGRLRFISPPPTPRRLPPKARNVGSGLGGRSEGIERAAHSSAPAIQRVRVDHRRADVAVTPYSVALSPRTRAGPREGPTTGGWSATSLRGRESPFTATPSRSARPTRHHGVRIVRDAAQPTAVVSSAQTQTPAPSIRPKRRVIRRGVG